MPLRLDWWPDDGSDEWLARTDGLLAVQLLRHLDTIRTEQQRALEPVLEVGVWKGAWTTVVLMNTSVDKVIGIDPYPNLAFIRDQMHSRIRSLNLDDRFQLVDALEGVPEGVTLSVIHLDGNHDEAPFESDLVFAAERIADDGVIIVDDFRHFSFPGVASALYRNLVTCDLRIFAQTEMKAYLARRDVAENHRRFISQAARESGLTTKSGYEAWGSANPYEQTASVLGQDIVLVGATRSSNRARVGRLRRLFDDIIPPIITRQLRRTSRMGDKGRSIDG